MRKRVLIPAIGVGLIAGGAIGVIAGQSFIWDEATNATVSTTAAVIGGLGSGIGGVAAAVAAAISWKSAASSSRAAENLRQIGAESRLALGRAMKPQLDPQLFLGSQRSTLTLVNTGQWPAMDVSVTVDIPGRPTYQAENVGGVEPGKWGTAKRLESLPRLPDPLEPWLSDGQTRGWKKSEARAVISYSDRDRILRHTDEITYTLNFAYGPNWSMEDAVPTTVSRSEQPL